MREEQLGGGTIFCGRVVGFWPLEVALEILQPAPVLAVHTLELFSVWLPKIAYKREKGKDVSGRALHGLLACTGRCAGVPEVDKRQR